MIERLLENWLDSASEVGYQTPFCQMLAARGHKVVHSTRHCPLELGKDVITIDPEGVPCAFQLKAHPGKRVTQAVLRGIGTQIHELITLPIIHPSIRANALHRSFLVTNGTIDEDASRIIDGWNLKYRDFPTLEVFSRCELLEGAVDLGSSLWPAELPDIEVVLRLMNANGRAQIPLDHFDIGLRKILLLDAKKASKITAKKLRRRITSASIFVSLALHAFTKSENHYAIMTAWTMYSCYVIGSCARYRVSYKTAGEPSVKIAMTAIKDCLASICQELSEKGHCVEGEALVDNVVHRGRRTLLIALMSLYYFWCKEAKWPNEQHSVFVQKFLSQAKWQELTLWGEGAIPQILMYYWYMSATQATSETEHGICELVEQICKSNLGNEWPCPSPYYGFEDCTRNMLHRFGMLKADPLADSSFRGSSFFALPLFHLLVRTGRKQACKSIWPQITRLRHRHFAPDSSWQYSLWRADEGKEISLLLEPKGEWQEVVCEAKDTSCPEVPSALLEQKYLHALFVLLFPYRATPSVVRHLSSRFDGTCFI